MLLSKAANQNHMAKTEPNGTEYPVASGSVAALTSDLLVIYVDLRHA